MSPRATILIPTWDAEDTLGVAIETALGQTLTDIEVLVVSDGAREGTLAVARAAALRDPRVRVLDLPKAPGRGERNRHAGVLAASAPAVVYLADDDLLLPRHAELLVGALANHDLVQSFNTYVDADDRLRLFPADLASRAWQEWHLNDPPRNATSLTGTAHTTAAYRRLEVGWVEPRAGMFADHTLWREFLRMPGIRAATLRDVTAIQFPAPLRKDMTPDQIRAQRRRWESFVGQPDAHERLQELAHEATLTSMLDAQLAVAALEDLVHARDREIAAIRSTRSWKLTAPLRAMVSWSRRRP